MSPEYTEGIIGFNYLKGNIEPGDKSTMVFIYVDKNERRTGKGSQMLRKFEEAARNAGSTSIDLLIMTPRGESPGVSISFFKKHGYEFNGDLGLGHIMLKNYKCYFPLKFLPS